MKSLYDKIVEAAALVDSGIYNYTCDAILNVGLDASSYFNWLCKAGGKRFFDRIDQWSYSPLYYRAEEKEHRVMMLLLYAEVTA